MKKEYKLEIWSYGHKVDEYLTDNYEKICSLVRSYLKADVGIKLFIDNVQIPYLDIKRTLLIDEFRSYVKG